MPSPEILRSIALALPAVAHGFLGRRGGASQGRFESFNLSRWVGDNPAAVESNWNRLSALLPPQRTVVLLNQIHGTTVHRFDRYHDGARQAGDGAVTTDTGVLLGIFTADCVPVLMVDRRHQVAGAIHAGWRGTLNGIARTGIDAMVAAGAALKHIRVALGPSIGPCCYEVDENLGARFAAVYRDSMRRVTAGRSGKAMIDLRGLLADQLHNLGVSRERIEAVGPCTRCAVDRFFSRRGAGGVQCGLQLSFIGFMDDHR